MFVHLLYEAYIYLENVPNNKLDNISLNNHKGLNDQLFQYVCSL